VIMTVCRLPRCYRAAGSDHDLLGVWTLGDRWLWTLALANVLGIKLFMRPSR